MVSLYCQYTLMHPLYFSYIFLELYYYYFIKGNVAPIHISSVAFDGKVPMEDNQVKLPLK